MTRGHASSATNHLAIVGPGRNGSNALCSANGRMKNALVVVGIMYATTVTLTFDSLCVACHVYCALDLIK